MSKAKLHSEKMKRKRAEKAGRRAKYAALAGTSKKSKRQQKKNKVAGTYKGAHIMTDCGNVGCKKCYPKLNRNRGTSKEGTQG